MPTALLRHELPDGTHHYDWLLARDWNGPLLTFRVGREISLDCKPFEAELLGDHRRAYLEYEVRFPGVVGALFGYQQDWPISKQNLTLRCGLCSKWA